MTHARTRFAPSPTGYMHIGGMRTALFCWLWARHTGGTFILRIDDTDRQRNLDEALAPILRAFRWLGLNWDEGPEIGGPYGPYFQSQRSDLYRQAAERLLAEGKAFKDYDAPEQIQADRERAQQLGQSYINIRRSLKLTDAQRAEFDAAGKPYVIRFLAPRDRKIAIEDAVRGHVEWDCGLMPDPVLMRGDGSALYNFATVVDDAQMRITHVIRAEEHLSNTPVQVLLHEALGNALPRFAHIPFITAPGSTKKLSKRDVDKMRNSPQLKKMFDRADEVFPKLGLGTSATLSPVMVEYYEKMGYLPAAILNALARLGWSLDDKTEILALPTVIENFTLDRIVKSPAGFDPDKLQAVQAHWMNQLPLEQKIDGCVPYLIKAGLVGTEESGVRGQEEEVRDERSEVRDQRSEAKGQTFDSRQSDFSTFASPHSLFPIPQPLREYVERVIRAMGDRLKLFSDILDYEEFFVPDERLAYDEKAFDKRLREPGAADLLRRFRERLATAEPFDAPTTDRRLHEFVEAEGIKIAQIIHALRVAVTGKAAGIGMFDALELLGRERSLNRIDRALQHLT